MLSRLLFPHPFRDQGNASKDLCAKRIALRHLQLLIRRDELGMFVRTTIAGGGILQFIHKSLTAGSFNKPGGALAA
ncbi:histone H2A.V-like protein [Lactarius deliciosus]|nr:histone H2A.V-like protein [Lactarius deliciosus]